MKRVLYLHGFASGPGSQKAQYFRRRFESLGMELEIPDLAERNFENLTITGQLRVIERAVGGRPVTLMGSSMGGYLAALYAARHEQVERMVLMAPALGFARRWPATLGEEKVEQWRRDGFLEMYHYGENRPAKVSYELLEDGARYEDFPHFEQPALIFHGAHEETVPVDYSREFAEAHPNARLEVLDSDHELLNVLDRMWEETERFVR